MASPAGTVSVRPMWLKVLYTFDAESKNNCVKRWPEILEVQTAFVDEQTQIGVVDLKICLQALVSSSPELLSQDALDYTIYAYDYSEHGTPLAGQGMLSSVFDPNVQDGSADAATKVITGKVTKNMLGLFSGNGQETLEVKLRLLPVTKQTQQRSMSGQSSQHSFSGSNYHNASGQEWSSSMSNDNRSMHAQRPARSGSPVDRTGLENMQRILHEGSVPRELSANRSSEYLHISSNSRPGSRAGTPGHAQPFNPPARPSFCQASRPSSRASVRGTSQPLNHKRRESFNSGYYSGDEIQMDEGAPRKRAKVSQIGAPSRSDLNIERQPESLRMAASTASSVRVHRPIAVNPALGNLQGNNSTEEPMRPPTPIPGSTKPGNRRQKNESSSLRRGSQLHLPSDTSYSGQAATEAMDIPPTSPEFARAPSISSTPAHIPSSPPIMTNYGSMPTSPILPPPPPEQNEQNFFGSEWPDMIDNDSPFADYFDDSGIGLQLQPSVEQNVAPNMYNQFTPVFEEGNLVDEEVAPGTLPPPPKPSNQSGPSKPPLPRAQTSRPAVRPGMSSPKLAPAPYPRARQVAEEMAAQSSLPPVAASDPVGRHLQRSNTWAGDMSDAPMSDAPLGEVGRAKSVSKKKVGREQTKARLENALAQNEMPPFCDNCGTINTPAWRKVCARTLPGHLYDSVQLLPETQGAYVWKQVTEMAEDGTIREFRAYKLSKSPEDKGDEWVNITLCNPCGLWFHKNKCMRPEDKWTKNPKDPNQKKKRAYRPKSKRVAAKKGQDDDSKSDVPDQGSEGSSPADAATEAEQEIEDDGQRSNAEMIDPELLNIQGRAASAEPTMPASNAAAAHHAAAGSELHTFDTGQVRHDGSHSHPVEADLTPKPLRRQLFSSPPNKTPSNSQCASTKDRNATPLSELPNFCRRSPRINKSTDVLSTHPKTPVATDKENRVLESAQNDDLNDLFNDDEDSFPLPPQTPTPTRRSDRLLLKTPSKTPSRTQTRAPGARMSPNAHQALQELQEPKTLLRDFIMGSNRTLEEMTPGTRLIHDELVKEAAAKNKSANVDRIPPAQQSDLDFPDLPPLTDMSPMSRQLASLDNIDFSGMNMDFPDMFPADQLANNSPPDGYYNFLDSDFVNDAQWVGMEPANVQVEDKENRPGVRGTNGLRRSPRKNKSG